jgi:hypothetical protein
VRNREQVNSPFSLYFSEINAPKGSASRTEEITGKTVIGYILGRNLKEK